MAKWWEKGGLEGPNVGNLTNHVKLDLKPVDDGDMGGPCRMKGVDIYLGSLTLKWKKKLRGTGKRDRLGGDSSAGER